MHFEIGRVNEPLGKRFSNNDFILGFPPAPSAPVRRVPLGKVPKKPGNIPPFALFVQDHRPGILEENKDIRFSKSFNLLSVQVGQNF